MPDTRSPGVQISPLTSAAGLFRRLSMSLLMTFLAVGLVLTAFAALALLAVRA
jgi:hypothetical protein